MSRALLQTISKYLSKHQISEYTIKQIQDLGEVSQVFKIETSSKNLILKVNSSDHYQNFLKEEWCIKQARELDIPTAQVYDVSNLENYSFLLLEFLEGDNCYLIDNDKIHKTAFLKLANYSAKLSNIRPNQNISDLYNFENAKKWFYMDYLEFEINQTSKPNDYLILDSESRKFVIESLDFLKNLDFEFVLCHGDLSLKNCLFNQQNNTYYLLDFGSSETHVKDYFEIMLKWIETFYEKTLNEEYFKIYVRELLNCDPDNWMNKNKSIIYSLALLYTLDKYRYAHDRAKSFEKGYRERFFSVLKLIRDSY